ncbi:hypothetical protein AZE42_10617, partial [Rhizopogon vesiculosus]
MRTATPMLRLVSHPQQQLSLLLQRRHPRRRRGHSTFRHSRQQDPHKKTDMTTDVGETFGMPSAASQTALVH